MAERFVSVEVQAPVHQVYTLFTHFNDFPMSSHYLFHEKSAVATGTTTGRQNRSMAEDPMMTPQELEVRREKQEQEKVASEQTAMERETAKQHQATLLEKTRREREAAMERQAELNREEEEQKKAQLAREATIAHEAAEQQDPTLNTLGVRGAAAPETPLGDRDSHNERFPDYQRGPDSTSPKKAFESGAEIAKTESPWRRAIRGDESLDEKEDTTQTSNTQENS